jgi:hypothetical protein
MAGKLKPLDIERETRPGKYPDGENVVNERVSLPEVRLRAI